MWKNPRSLTISFGLIKVQNSSTSIMKNTQVQSFGRIRSRDISGDDIISLDDWSGGKMPHIIFDMFMRAVASSGKKEQSILLSYMMKTYEAWEGCYENGNHWLYEEETPDEFHRVLAYLKAGHFEHKDVRSFFCDK